MIIDQFKKLTKGIIAIFKVLFFINPDLNFILFETFTSYPSSKANRMSVTLFVCLFLNSSETAASIKLKISGNIPLDVQKVLG